ncbi:toll/interleukin-1 receptor domain-containing protein [Hymenobacter sp. BT683]|uniref:Toll/interleukin-1 receptor domain-containing protein n=1 Tax=Hymenobacter jeongseonensis TaxID=2791027 RepID=A0ABS0IE72_9BACT|nr:toll/interleukin-1 receptor domain-containing protein [Hymenobacter jeongseonensis]MBF9236605.1 toll/interleukin-1 receptor domain-containing protein [Hymenobacter jeongseonensis]
MDLELKIKRLERALEKAESVKGKSRTHSEFKAWQHHTNSTMLAVFGAESYQTKQIQSIKYTPKHNSKLVAETDEAFKARRQVAVDYCLTIAIGTLTEYLLDLKEEMQHNRLGSQSSSEKLSDSSRVNRVFISHATTDRKYVEELVDLLKLMGLNRSQIFCTSVRGYGIPLGANFLNEIKAQISNDVLVLFVFSSNFYASPICLAELGAAWALSKQHIPVVIPPFGFSDIKSVLPHTQGLMLNDKLEINELATKVESLFGLDGDQRNDDWERSRDRVVERINTTIAQDAAALTAKTHEVGVSRPPKDWR